MTWKKNPEAIHSPGVKTIPSFVAIIQRDQIVFLRKTDEKQDHFK